MYTARTASSKVGRGPLFYASEFCDGSSDTLVASDNGAGCTDLGCRGRERGEERVRFLEAQSESELQFSERPVSINKAENSSARHLTLTFGLYTHAQSHTNMNEHTRTHTHSLTEYLGAREIEQLVKARAAPA